MSPVLFVGMNPGGPFRRNSTHHRLNRWLDEVGLAHVSFVNCSSRPGAFEMGGSDWRNLREAVEGYDRIVSLGGIADRCLRTIGVRHHHPMPHPSPRNRLWNDPATEPERLSGLRAYLGHK